MKTPPPEPPWELQGNPRFELRRRLGAGAFGAVFEVFDRERGAKVALKLLKRIEPEELYRFKQEFRALADMTHPNLVQLYELLGQGDRWFFTMELVDGSNALSYVRRSAVLADAPTLDARTQGTPAGDDGPTPDGAERCDEPRLRSVLAQLAEGLTALHRAGKLHRDVKPSNVLVTPEGRVVLVDFGLAVRLSTSGELSRSMLVGTPGYLAPEIIVGKPATPASDWYAVGVMLYEALTGQSPFEGTMQSVFAAKIREDPPAPSRLRPAIPPDLDRLCVGLLSRSPEARPGAAQLLDRGGALLSSRPPPAAPFVGRAAERAALVRLFQEGPRQGHAAVALVAGPSGMGKSALLGRALADLREIAPETVILAGRCFEQESVPFKAIDALVDPLSRHLEVLPAKVVQKLLPREVRALARLFPVLDRVMAIADAPVSPVVAFDVRGLRRTGFRALRDLLARLARTGPLVLAIDDLQWGDADSGALLLDLLAPPDPPPLLLVLAYRSEDVETSACLRAALPALRAGEGPGLHVTSLELAALAEAEATELAQSLLPEGIGAGAATVAEEAGRSPFFIHELAQHGGAGDGAVPSLDALVRARVADLPDAARRLLEVVAVAGRPVDRTVAARVAGLGDGEPAIYGALRSSRLVRSRDHGGRREIEPYHDRIREAVASGLPASRRAEVFRGLAEALEGARFADAETLAVYFLEGGSPDRAAGFVQVAAEEAARHLAFDRAARLYRQALDLCPAGDPRAPALREAFADALITAGRGADAAEALALAATTAPPERAFELRRRAAEQLLFAGHVDEGLAALRACLADVGLSWPAGARRRTLGLLWGIAALVLGGFRFRPAARLDPSALRRADTLLGAARAFNTTDAVLSFYLCTRATRLALAAGEPRRALEAVALFAAFVLTVFGSRTRLLRRPQATMEALAAELGDVRARTVIDFVSANAALQNGEPAAARAPLEAVSAAARELRMGASWEVNLLSELTCMHLYQSGAWGELSATLATTIAEARGQGNQHLVRSLSSWFGHIPFLLADDPEGALRADAELRAAWWPPGFTALHWFSFVGRAETHLYADRGAGPLSHRGVEAEWQTLQRSGLPRIQTFMRFGLSLRARAALAFAARGAGPEERPAVLAIAERSTRRLLRTESPLAKAFGELAGAGLALARDEPADAIERYARAEAAFDALGCVHYAAAAKRRRGSILGGAEGRKLIAAADDRFAAEGARDPARIAAMLAPGPAMPEP